MQAVDVYLMYCALKAHFKGDYDYHKFSGQTKVKRDSFWKRKDRVFFVKIGRKYDDGEILNYFVSNFIKDRDGYIANFNEQNYDEWLQKRKMFYEIFSTELQPFVKNFNPLFESKLERFGTCCIIFENSSIDLELCPVVVTNITIINFSLERLLFIGLW